MLHIHAYRVLDDYSVVVSCQHGSDEAQAGHLLIRRTYAHVTDSLQMLECLRETFELLYDEAVRGEVPLYDDCLD